MLGVAVYRPVRYRGVRAVYAASWPRSLSLMISSAWVPVPLARLTSAAEELEVVDVVGAALGLGNDVVDLEVAEVEHDPAAGAVALLLAVELVLMRPVVGQLAQVGPVGDIGLVVDLGEHAELVLEALLDQNVRHLGEVDPDPLPVEGLGRYAGGGAAAEGVEDDVAGVRAGLDDAIEEGEGFLGGVADPFLRNRQARNVSPPVFWDFAFSQRFLNACRMVSFAVFCRQGLG